MLSKNEAMRQMLSLREAKRIDSQIGAKSMLLGVENNHSIKFRTHKLKKTKTIVMPAYYAGRGSKHGN